MTPSDDRPAGSTAHHTLDEARAAIAAHTRLVADFPGPGVQFKDLTPVLAESRAFASIITALAHGCPDIDLVGGIDARGFLLGGAVARELGVGVLAVRKQGKLPPPVHTVTYDLEYGSAALEIPADGLDLTGRRVLLIDDVLATGGTAVAAATLMRTAGAHVVRVSVIMELTALGGRATIARGIGSDVEVHALVAD
ncbi:adenine phosphoribosyltransferase [Gordonia sp. (in: high G+C Gram-positive bacteria)]|uniref:adenine phosphoribosyltransferase n=1 Tax=Gordonia sp. (in: high G+C Gram-positive bacteria) TaxID=84139 RepID=UPI001DEE0C47|nr:adenine phosphoribosyltransferase [Gordonia sp. (in: high G+C Gram-positive bacteria)]MCB1294500.1 adenine phosphoribosyltransferase [Gordonia sp. (in: high G+C Gram-positive bacteria)]HMS76339.1 adenine phosphoribosyltransferase [Gordonia sp. (in: high G+C Gram-positive bacteria)]HQV19623.1 adenine phosphoribosyltransferase [Gordonia sp. (in: high G+C Gram-positive bacteria)]